jgi:hypothetical protein
MSEEMKEKDDGGLMYQQLRKFISVIVSFLTNLISNLIEFKFHKKITLF